MLEKILFVTRGIPGSGKSTFVNRHLANTCIICPDELRIKYVGIKETENGPRIDNSKDKFVWDKVFLLLEESLKNNQYTTLDATSTKQRDLNKYLKLCKEYNAKLIIIDFSKVSLLECKLRNIQREIMWFSDEKTERSPATHLIGSHRSPKAIYHAFTPCSFGIRLRLLPHVGLSPYKSKKGSHLERP